MTQSDDITAVYQESLDFLYGLINFELKRTARYMASKLDAGRPGRIMAFLGDPHRRFPAIHIAGTKGKGSVAAMCAYSLQAAGYRVGLYTSPHVVEFRERIRILTPDDADGRVSEADFVALMADMRRVVTEVPGVTWFEAVTALAFLHFARQQVDVAVVEVGLGGRLDATNVLTPLVSVITSLSFDHTDLLGDTLDKIAWEKGGIVKPGVPFVTAPQRPEALAKLQEIAVERESPITIIGQTWQFEGGERTADSRNQELIITRSPSSFIPHPSSFPLALAGAHQLENGAVALAALTAAQSHFPRLTLAAIRAGLAAVQWPGRLQLVHQADDTPDILLDCAHNQDSAAKLRHALAQEFAWNRLFLVLGATGGKDVSGMMTELLPLARRTIVTQSSHPRAASPDSLRETAVSSGFSVDMAPTIADALRQIWQTARPGDLICVAGSIFIAGDLLNQWDGLQSQLLYLNPSFKLVSSLAGTDDTR